MHGNIIIMVQSRLRKKSEMESPIGNEDKPAISKVHSCYNMMLKSVHIQEQEYEHVFNNVQQLLCTSSGRSTASVTQQHVRTLLNGLISIEAADTRKRCCRDGAAVRVLAAVALLSLSVTDDSRIVPSASSFISGREEDGCFHHLCCHIRALWGEILHPIQTSAVAAVFVVADLTPRAYSIHLIDNIYYRAGRARARETS